MATASALTVFLRADAKQFSQSIKKAESQVVGFSRSLSSRGIEQNIAAITSRLRVLGLQGAYALGKVRKSFQALKGPLALMTGAGAGGIGLMVNSSREAAAEAEKFGKSLGVPASTMSELGVLARRFNAETEDMADVIKDFNVRVTDAANGNKTYEAVLRSVGLRSADLAKKTPIEQLYAFSDALSGVSKQAQVFALDELVSDPGVRLAAILSQGSAMMKELQAEIRATGASLSEFDIAQIKVGTMAFREMKEQGSALGNIITGELTPFFRVFTGEIMNNAGEARSWSSTIRDGVEAVTFGFGMAKDVLGVFTGAFKVTTGVVSLGAFALVNLARAADMAWIGIKNLATLGAADNFSNMTRELERMSDAYGAFARETTRLGLEDIGSGITFSSTREAMAKFREEQNKTRQDVEKMLADNQASGANMVGNLGKTIEQIEKEIDAEKKAAETLATAGKEAPTITSRGTKTTARISSMTSADVVAGAKTVSSLPAEFYRNAEAFLRRIADSNDIIARNTGREQVARFA